jgi:hypothetical protein
MTKTLNQIIFFFLYQNQNIFFSNIGNQNIFLEKNHNPPFKLNGRSLSSQELFKQTCIIKLHILNIKYSTIKHVMQYKLIHIQIIFMHTFLCFDVWTPTASAHVASASLHTYCHRTSSQNRK